MGARTLQPDGKTSSKTELNTFHSPKESFLSPATRGVSAGSADEAQHTTWETTAINSSTSGVSEGLDKTGLGLNTPHLTDIN